MSFIQKILKCRILKHGIIAVVSIFIVLFLVSIYLKAYTHHGEEIYTPSFKGMQLEEAQQLAAEKHVKIVVIDSVFEAYAQPGAVIDQTPKANFQVKEGRTIFVTIKARGQKIVTMPDLRSISLIQARSEIETANLKIGQITYKASQYNDLVIEQKLNGEIIAPGTEIPAGTRIDLIVGKKQGVVAVVPDLKGLTRSDAEFKAAENSLNIGNVFYDDNVITTEDSATAVVYKQSVNPGIEVEYGAEVDIWLKVE